ASPCSSSPWKQDSLRQKSISARKPNLNCLGLETACSIHLSAIALQAQPHLIFPKNGSFSLIFVVTAPPAGPGAPVHILWNPVDAISGRLGSNLERQRVLITGNRQQSFHVLGIDPQNHRAQNGF